MIELNFRMKENGVPILSKDEIESIANIVLNDYNSKILNELNILDIEDFIEYYLKLDMDYQDLSHNQSVLGMTIFNDCCVPVYDVEKNEAKYISSKKGTVLIDNSILGSNQIRRGRFTLGHEAGHWLLHRAIYGVVDNQMSFFDRADEQRQTFTKCRISDIEKAANSRRKLTKDEDWIEWQADYLSAALLMPKATFTRVVNKRFIDVGIINGYYK